MAVPASWAAAVARLPDEVGAVLRVLQADPAVADAATNEGGAMVVASLKEIAVSVFCRNNGLLKYGKLPNINSQVFLLRVLLQWLRLLPAAPA